MKEHSDLAPTDVGQRSDQIQKVEQSAITVQNVVIAQWIEMPVALKAAGQPSEARTALDQRDVLDPGQRQGVGRRDT